MRSEFFIVTALPSRAEKGQQAPEVTHHPSLQGCKIEISLFREEDVEHLQDALKSTSQLIEEAAVKKDSCN